MSDKRKSSFYLIGGLAGALLGVGIAHVLLKTSENDETSLQLTPQKGMQIGITTVGFFRNLLDLLK
jgi:hypothetical protein